MADEMEGRVIIAAERIGLPPNATPQDIEAQVYRMAERLGNLEKALADAVRVAAENKKSGDDLAALQAKVVVEEAIRHKWIDKSEEKYFIEDYITNPARTQMRIDDRKYRSILTQSQSLRGAIEQPDVDVEINAAAEELRAKNQHMTEGEAMLAVLKSNPELAARRRNKMLGLGGAN